MNVIVWALRLWYENNDFVGTGFFNSDPIILNYFSNFLVQCIISVPKTNIQKYVRHNTQIQNIKCRIKTMIPYYILHHTAFKHLQIFKKQFQ